METRPRHTQQGIYKCLLGAVFARYGVQKIGILARIRD